MQIFCIDSRKPFVLKPLLIACVLLANKYKKIWFIIKREIQITRPGLMLISKDFMEMRNYLKYSYSIMLNRNINENEFLPITVR